MISIGCNRLFVLACGLVWLWPTLLFALPMEAIFKTQGPPLYWPSPNGHYVLLADLDAYAETPAPTLQLLGQSYAASWPLELSSVLYQQLRIVDVSVKPLMTRSVPLPVEAPVADFQWSPDSTKLAVALLQQNELKLWIYQLNTQQWQPWPNAPALSGYAGKPLFIWVGEKMLVRTQAKTAACADEIAHLKTSRTQSSQGRWYQDLLDTPRRQCQFTQLRAQQLRLLSQTQNQLLWQGLVEAFSVSPDQHYLLVQQLQQPLANALKLAHQGRQYEVIRLSDQQVMPALDAQQGAAVRGDGAPEGARLVRWHAGQAATLLFAQKKPGSDKDPSDVLWQWPAPFTTPAIALVQVPARLFDVYSDSAGGVLFASWTKHSQTMRWDYRLGHTQTLLSQFNYRQVSADPGVPYSQSLPDGRTQLVRSQQGRIWFQQPNGKRHSAVPPAPLMADTIVDDWRPLYWPSPERPEQMLAFNENPSWQQRYWWLAVGSDKAQQSSAQWVADWQTPPSLQVPPSNQLQSAMLKGALYAPAAHCAKPWPVLVWLYPDPKAAPLDAVLSPMSPFFALSQCVAVLDLTAEQVTADALKTLLRQHAELDTKRIVLMGHSFGANAVLELLAASTDFVGGIARSGAYNRTLTPLGYQLQDKTLWQDLPGYLQASPLLRAEQIKAPVLLVHGGADQNPGTTVLQSEQLFAALQAMQKDVQLLVLNNEAHQYQRRSSLEQLLQVQHDWLARVLSQTATAHRAKSASASSSVSKPATSARIASAKP